MAIFKDKKDKPSVKMASAPEEPETPGEIKHIEDLSSGKDMREYREIPVCLSQEQINNYVIENNIMLKEVLAKLV
jgi:hypothetical protein